MLVVFIVMNVKFIFKCTSHLLRICVMCTKHIQSNANVVPKSICNELTDLENIFNNRRSSTSYKVKSDVVKLVHLLAPKSNLTNANLKIMLNGENNVVSDLRKNMMNHTNHTKDTSRRFFIENEKPTIIQCLTKYKHFTLYDGDIVSYILVLINTRFILINNVFHQILHEFKLIYPTLAACTHIPKFNALMV